MSKKQMGFVKEHDIQVDMVKQTPNDTHIQIPREAALLSGASLQTRKPMYLASQLDV